MPDKKGVHDWLQSAHVALVPGPATHLLESFAAGLLDAFRALGHDVQAKPNKATNLILTFARVGKPISWREALSFTISWISAVVAPSRTIFPKASHGTR